MKLALASITIAHALDVEPTITPFLTPHANQSSGAGDVGEGFGKREPTAFPEAGTRTKITPGPIAENETLELSAL